VETITVSLDLPVSAPLSASVRALEAARDAQTDPKAKQALAMVTALASRGLVQTLAQSLRTPEDKGSPPPKLGTCRTRY
jgi:hypothetical protein